MSMLPVQCVDCKSIHPLRMVEGLPKNVFIETVAELMERLGWKYDGVVFRCGCENVVKRKRKVR